MTVTLKLSPDAEKCLREKATQSGQTLEDYLRQLVERDIQAATGTTETDSTDQVSPAEFERRLDELSEGLTSIPTLPADWSRADIYADHD
jgi:predicted DNA-binding protein